MTARPRETLYSPALLALATSLADYPYDPLAPCHGDARSRTCGSTLACSIAPGERGEIEALGLKVSACAVGQAAAAIFAAGARGCTSSDIEAAEQELAEWLGGSGLDPGWPGIEALRPALDFPGRHGAITLPWRAASVALCKAEAGG